MYKALNYLTLTALMMLFAVQLNAQTQKKSNFPVAIVDITIIASQMPESQEAEKKLKDIQKNITDSLTAMQENFQKRVEAYVKQKNMMQPAEQQKQEDAFRAEEQQILMYREQKLQELNQKREELVQPIREKIVSAISKIAKEDKLMVVLDKSNPYVLYSDDSTDITFKVLDRIKRGS